MTTPTLDPRALSQLAAFKGCSDTTLRAICKNAELNKFGVGHALSTAAIIPNRVLLILSGKARLLSKHRGQLNTLAILGAGTFVGLASYLRAEGCEEISAKTEIEALSIPDKLIAEIYNNEESFKKWCNETIFPSEIAALLETLIDQAEKLPYAISEVLGKTLSVATSQHATEITISNLESSNVAYIASRNDTIKLNSIIDKSSKLPVNQGPFDLRMIILPRTIVDHIKRGRSEKQYTENRVLTQSSEDSIPSRTSIELDGTDPKNTLNLIRGNNTLEESLACFKMIAQLMELPFRKDAVEKSVREVLKRGIKPSLPMYGQLLTGMGLLATGAKVEASFCTRLNVPCLIEWKESWGVLIRSNAKGLLIAHPRHGWIEAHPEQVAEQAAEGFNVIFVERSSESANENFNFGWFLPAIQRYRSTLLLVLGSSFIVQLFTLANPLLIQVIIDKVISQRSLDTLQVLGIALVGVTVFEGIINSLRIFLFTDTTNRIDMRLGAEVIDHLLRLPVGYFDRRPVGELGTRIAELEKIRNFLTGEALTTTIDAAFSIIYIIVMALYSWILTLVALLVVPIQVAITLAGAPLFRRQFRQSAEANASTQSHLVEVLTGIQTVKAQNVEIVSRWKWQERYSKYISRTFEKTITGTALGQTGQVLQKLSQLMVLWVGASLVLKGELTLGQLIAFRIISGYVTQPLLRLSTIWQRIQELKVSFERLADIVDTPEESTEIDKAKIPLPPIVGNVSFEDIHFRFKPGSPQVLQNISLDISAGNLLVL